MHTMTQTTDIVLTRSADGLALVLLPEHALGETSLATTRDKLTSFADDGGAGELRLDFSQIEYLGSAGLGTLVSLHRRFAQKDGDLGHSHLGPGLVTYILHPRLASNPAIPPVPGRSAP